MAEKKPETDLNSTCEKGMTALMHASERGDMLACLTLIEAGNDMGETAFLVSLKLLCKVVKLI